MTRTERQSTRGKVVSAWVVAGGPKTGTFVVEPQFYCKYPFSEGRGVVTVVADGVELFGYFDQGGSVVIDPEFGAAGPFLGVSPLSMVLGPAG